MSVALTLHWSTSPRPDSLQVIKRKCEMRFVVSSRRRRQRQGVSGSEVPGRSVPVSEARQRCLTSSERFPLLVIINAGQQQQRLTSLFGVEASGAGDESAPPPAKSESKKPKKKKGVLDRPAWCGES